MNTQTLNVRDLARNMRKVTSAVERGQSFTVLRNGKSVFRIEPVGEDDASAQQPFLSLTDLEQAQFEGPRDLSKHIDEVVYGV